MWESKHFVVVEKVTSKFVWVIDPELGKLRYDLNRVSSAVVSLEFLISISSSDRVIKQKSKRELRRDLCATLAILAIFCTSVISNFCKLCG